MAPVEIKVPDIGDFEDVPVIEVHVAPGDTVAEEDPLVTLESDKATMDIPSPAAGTVAELKVEVGASVSQGSVLLVLETEGAAPASAPAAPPPRRPPPAAPRARATATPSRPSPRPRRRRTGLRPPPSRARSTPR